MEQGDVEFLERIFEGIIKPTDVKLAALQSITENFSEERIIGEGGFATVYKGVLRNGEVAVKRIKNNHTIDEKLFRREVNSLLNVSHGNIVRFLGFCSHTEHKAIDYKGSGEYIYAEDRERILCFEYIKKGSLEKYIADELRGLPWDTRSSIIKGICEGLQYLHMEKQIIHRDLKPANILIDNNMVAKITDFGLSRREENRQTKSTTRVSSPGYAAPEYIEKGEMSFKYDVYSLGIIIIELVTGHRSIHDSNDVIRRWRHRWHKSGKETPFRYQQITKLIEIGLLCQEKDPYKRPFISDIICVINELESMNMQIRNANKSTIGELSPYFEDDMLGIEPLDLCFPFEPNTRISRSLELTNETSASIAFNIQTTSPLPYCIQPKKDIVAPESKYIVNIILQPLDKEPQDKYTGNFIVRSTKVNEVLVSEDITEDIFNREKGKLVDEVNLTITYKDKVPPVDVPLGSLISSDTRNVHCPHESNVPPTEAESKISASTSDEVIQCDPPELSFPLVPDKKVLSSVKIINITESYVSLLLCSHEQNSANYSLNSSISIMPPRSTQWLTLTRKENEDAVKDMQFTDQLFVWYAIVAENIKSTDLVDGDYSYSERMILPILLTKVNSCTSNELIQFDPPEPRFPCLNKPSLSSVNIVNITDCYVGFNPWYYTENDVADYRTDARRLILAPQSTQRMVVGRVPKEKKPEDMQFECSSNNLFVWNMIVAEGVEASNLIDCTSDEDSKELFCCIHENDIPCTSTGLIQFEPAELSLPFVPNRPLVFSVNIVNNTDYYVCFDKFLPQTNVDWYCIKPAGGVIPPRSTQRLVVKRVPDKKKQDDTQCEDKFFLWSTIVSEGVKAGDIVNYVDDKGSTELPIFYKKTSLCTSKELIQFDRPEVPFHFMPNKRVSMLCSFKILNVTNHNVGFSIWYHEENSACYTTEPKAGILPPQSTQAIKVIMTLKKMVQEDMRCKDKIFVWNGIVTEGVQVSDVGKYLKNDDKELPVVLTKITSPTLVELIKFEPPEVRFPFLPSKRLISSIKLVNTTDYHIGFNTHVEEKNVALYITEPLCGVLPPWSTQELVVTRLAKEEASELEDIQCKDKYFVSSTFVTEDVNASDLKSYMPENEGKELPIVFIEASSNELIQFHPRDLFLPLLQKQRVLSLAKMVNITDQYIGYRICEKKSNSTRYNLNPSKGILPPLSTQVLSITSVAQETVLEDTQFKDKIFVWNGIVTEDVKASDVIENITETKCTELPIVLTKTGSSTSDETIQFDPLEFHFPLLPDKKVLSSFKIVNLTDYNVGFNTYSSPTNAAWYHTEPLRGILPPRSTQKVIVTREEKEDALTKEKQLDDKYFVWQSIVSEGVKESDLCDCMADQDSKELPIVLDKISSLTSDELIQLDPPELRMPHWPNKKIKFIVNVVNPTDLYVAFNVYTINRTTLLYNKSSAEGILPPRSTKRCILHWIIDDGEPTDDYFVWNGVVTEAVESGDIVGYMVEEESKKLPFIIDTVTPCPSNELIQFDLPELSLPFMPNKPLVFPVNIVNNTDYYVCFNVCNPKKNVGWYRIKPAGGVMPPRSTQRLIVKRVPDEKERDGMQCEDKFFLWSSLVSECVEDKDIFICIDLERSKELPIVYKKTSLCASEELIQFDPPQLTFPFLPNKRVTMLCFFKIVNVTDHNIGFSIWYHAENSAQYVYEPHGGILSPQSTQAIKVRRTLKENVQEDMQCKDKIFVWSGIVTEGVEVSDVQEFWNDEDKELPVILTKPGEGSSR